MIVILSLLSAVVIGSAQNGNQNMFDIYISLKDAFVKSDINQINATSLDFIEIIESKGKHNNQEVIVETLKSIIKAKDIDKKRELFSIISSETWSIIKNSEILNDTFYYQYCPMKKAHWISKEATIKNPYYGSKMLSCGSVSEIKN